MHKIFVLLFLHWAVICVSASPPKIFNDGNKILVTHPQYKLVTYQNSGGITEIIGLKGGGLLAPPEGNQSLLLEIFKESAMEGKVPVLKYQFKTESINNSSIIKLSTVLTKAVAGDDLDGVLMTRSMIVDPDKPYLTVKMTFHNPTNKLRYVSFGIQNRFRVEKYNESYYYLPTTRNVLEMSKTGMIWNYYQGEPWEYSPVAGWLAINDPKRKIGIAFCMDYNLLEAFYVSGKSSTIGWYCDGGLLPPGKTFQTQYTVIPVRGFNNISYASPELIAGIRPPVKGQRKIVITAVSPDKIKLAKMDVSAYIVRQKKLNFLGKNDLHLSGMKPESLTINYPDTISGPCDLKVTAKLHAKKLNFNQYAENGTRSQPIPALALNIEHKTVAPRQIRKELKSAVVNNVKRDKKVLIFYGIYTQHYQLDKVFKGWDVKINNCPPARAKFFPPASTIDKYSMLVFSDINMGCLTGSIIRRIKRYVENGGNLLILGGPYAYGQGRYHESELESILPVKCAYFDLQPATAIITAAPGSNIKIAGKPYIFWRHNCPPKPGAKIWLNAGKKPLLVVGKYGKGYVLCLLSAPLGKVTKEQPAFWQWPGWIKMLQGIVDKLHNDRNTGEQSK